MKTNVTEKDFILRSWLDKDETRTNILRYYFIAIGYVLDETVFVWFQIGFRLLQFLPYG